MTKNLTSTIHTFQQLAALHSAIAEYLTRVEEGMSAEELQKLWYQGFESFGPQFADILSRIDY